VSKAQANDGGDTNTAEVEAVRAFNRFWTARIGVLSQSHLETPYSLTEARVLFELAQRPSTEVGDLRRTLDLDPGYLSRILGAFKVGGLVEVAPSEADRRQKLARLTGRGRRAYDVLNARSASSVRAMLARLTKDERRELVGAMGTLQGLLGAEARSPRSFVLRAPRAGELGWVVYRHGALYSEEYGWDETFEALVATLVAEYAARERSPDEAAWIAEVDGEPAGCVFCVRKSAKVAQLRLLLVEPRARGMGLGARLVLECIRFARLRGYQRLTLWTNDVLHSARRIYEEAGFVLVTQKKHRAFGHALVAQTWSLDL
jgi:DNA-binding MarR family transcriptional regulator/GNAT superfamily N-acetyltransferase